MSPVTLGPLEAEFGSKTGVEQVENKRSPLTILRKMLSEVTPGLQQLNRKAHVPFRRHAFA
jgi:hypothetical protein